MSYQSTQSERFRSTVDAWIQEEGEVLLLTRFSHAGGAKSYEFFSTFAAFQERLNALNPKTCVIVFKERQLPLRGVVDEQFIEAAKQIVADGEEYLLTCLERTVIGKASWYHESSGETHQEMEEDLKDCLGERVAFGKYPPWLYDNESVISAVVPEPNVEVTDLR